MRQLKKPSQSADEGGTQLRTLEEAPWLHQTGAQICMQYINSVHGSGDVLAPGAGTTYRLFEAYPEKYMLTMMDRGYSSFNCAMNFISTISI